METNIQEITDTQYHELWMDLPIGAPRNPPTAEAAMEVPGCAVKSKEMLPDQQMMCRYFGKLQAYDAAADKVVVISFPKETPVFKWEGTVSQYKGTWNCD